MARVLSKIPVGKIKSLTVSQKQKLSQQKQEKKQAKKAANVAQYEKEKAARGATGYSYSQHLMKGSSSTSNYNPRQRTFEEFMAICEAKVPVTRQAGDFKYPGKTGEEKAERRANVLSKSEDPKKRRQANTIRSRIQTVAARDTARASSDARQKLYRGQQIRANQLAQQLMNKA